jgi:hypothetical protein
LRESSDYQTSGEFIYSKAYKGVFIQRVHQLIGMGYANLMHSEFSDAKEEDITGELVRAIELVLDNPKTDPWTDSFSIHEEPRIHDPNRKGKRRRRLDIRIDSTVIRPRCRLCFEAKCLGKNHNISNYLGNEGLHRFIDGRYALDDDIGGMLGYVQDGNCDEWAKKIEAVFLDNKKNLSLMITSPWRKEMTSTEVPFTYHSGHKRLNLQQQIEIYHILLCFN